MMSFEGWVIALACGRTFVGKLQGAEDGSSSWLEPVFDLQSGLVEAREGLGHMLVATPVLGLSTIRRATLPSERMLFAVEDLSASIRERLAKAIEVAGQVQTQLRAAESGIAMASANAKLPPLRGK